eukprot:5450806-Alexandrium_andersonii.AAC.1
MSRPVPVPRSSRSDGLKQLCMCRRAGRGSERIAASVGLERVADSTTGTLQRQDPSKACLLYTSPSPRD